jgi:acyl-coenzyme A thioesterase PaaI-like protein
MVLPPPKGFHLPPLVALRAQAPKITLADLTADERGLYQHAERALKQVAGPADSFIERFWGFRTRANRGGASATLKNGQHAGNRVGHVQGGLLLGLAQSAARAALPAGWSPSAVSACYLSPGVGASLTARAQVMHRGSRTAVVRVSIAGAGRRRVHETLMTWAAPE